MAEVSQCNWRKTCRCRALGAAATLWCQPQYFPLKRKKLWPYNQVAPCHQLQSFWGDCWSTEVSKAPMQLWSILCMYVCGVSSRVGRVFKGGKPSLIIKKITKLKGGDSKLKWQNDFQGKITEIDQVFNTLAKQLPRHRSMPLPMLNQLQGWCLREVG